MKHIGILGGAFDPPHDGHIALANTASMWCDEVWIMPTYKNTLGKELTAEHHRLTMCQFAKAGAEYKIVISPFEIHNKIEGGTYELITKLKLEFPDYRFSFIIGQDNAETVSSWKNAEELIKIVSFLVFPRKGYPVDYKPAWYKEQAHQFLWNADPNQTLVQKEAQISSTRIRKEIREGKKPEFIDRLVYEYILYNKLYQN